MQHGTESVETWLPIPGYETRYDVSNEGRVRSWRPRNGHPAPYVLRPSLDSDGYRIVSLCDGPTERTIAVHRLVMLAFVGPRPRGLVTRHLNGQRLNNTLVNLSYGTVSENALDSVAHGTNPKTLQTHCKRGHEFTEENTYRRKDSGHGHRACKACGIMLQRARRGGA